MRIGFVGLGVMGGPMAVHLFLKGMDVQAWNRSPERREAIAAQGVPMAHSLNELSESSDIVCLCVSKTEDVVACLDTLRPSARPGTLFIDHSTILASAARSIAIDLKSAGFRFIDAPITGGSMGAKNGALTIFCGGEPADIEQAAPVFQCYAKKFERVGGNGDGQRMKAANQIAVAGALLALCESLAFADRCGLDLEQTRDLLSGGAAGSWAFENYGPKILERNWAPGFSIDNQIKDLAYCEETAASIGAALPGTMLVHDLLLQMSSEGRGGETTCALFEMLRELEHVGAMLNPTASTVRPKD